MNDPFKPFDYIRNDEELTLYVTGAVEIETKELRAKLSKALELLARVDQALAPRVSGFTDPFCCMYLDVRAFLKENGHG